jgi:hypothetical protein
MEVIAAPPRSRQPKRLSVDLIGTAERRQEKDGGALAPLLRKLGNSSPSASWK